MSGLCSRRLAVINGRRALSAGAVAGRGRGRAGSVLLNTIYGHENSRCRAIGGDCASPRGGSAPITAHLYSEPATAADIPRSELE